MIKKFSKLTRDEQILSIIFSAFMLLGIIFLLNSWLTSQKSDSLLDLELQKDLLNKTKRAVLLKSQIKNTEKVSSGNISSTISSMARSYSLTIDRIQPSDKDEVTVSINNAKFIDLYNWLIKLEKDSGISPVKVSIRKNSSRSNLSGVKAQIVLRSL
tara:strand:- start:10091 stop:10561 length:471 start_codon:yes stop_codon:yes gene_type:complete